MKISNEMLKEFRNDFKAAMEDLQEKYDATITLGMITYDKAAERFSAKLEVKNSRDADTVASDDFDTAVWKFEHLGLAKGMYGIIGVGSDGEEYAITGLNTKAKKYPLMLTCVKDGSKIRAG